MDSLRLLQGFELKFLFRFDGPFTSYQALVIVLTFRHTLVVFHKRHIQLYYRQWLLLLTM
jgi:hypothetical protein